MGLGLGFGTGIALNDFLRNILDGFGCGRSFARLFAHCRQILVNTFIGGFKGCCFGIGGGNCD